VNSLKALEKAYRMSHQWPRGISFGQSIAFINTNTFSFPQVNQTGQQNTSLTLNDITLIT